MRRKWRTRQSISKGGSYRCGILIGVLRSETKSIRVINILRFLSEIRKVTEYPFSSPRTHSLTRARMLARKTSRRTNAALHRLHLIRPIPIHALSHARTRAYVIK